MYSLTEHLQKHSRVLIQPDTAQILDKLSKVITKRALQHKRNDCDCSAVGAGARTRF
jgi:hypothetical protein